MCYLSLVNAASGDAGARLPVEGRGRLHGELTSALAEWTQLMGRSARPNDPAALRLATTAAELSARARAVGFGGIAVHLGELVTRFRAGDPSARESLEVVTHLAQQAWYELTPAEQQEALGAPPVVAGPPGLAPPRAGADQLSPPPMITGFRNRSDAPPPAADFGSSGPQSVRPPPLLDASIGKAVESPPAPPPLKAEPAPFTAAKPVASVSPKAPQSARGGPNLLVRSMLGLRAFGKRAEGATGPTPAISEPPPERGSLLNLKKISGANPAVLSPNEAPRPPALLDRPLSGLPALPTNQRPAERSHSERPAAERLRSERPPAARSADGRSPSQMGELLGDMRRGRVSRPSGGVRRSSLARPREGEAGWKIGLLIGISVLVVLGGMVTIIVALSRRDASAERQTQANGGASASSASSGSGAQDLPQVRLSTDSERLRQMLAQVHGQGKESPELRALVDEQAALVARTLGAKKCEDGALLCAEAAKVRESVLGQTNGHRVVKRRPPPSPDRLRSAWLVGLKLPEIPVEDDPRVRRRFEFYTENPVGRETFQAMLFRCGAYRDLIQSTLIRYGLPTDLLAVVFAESGCEPHATSPVGAAGLWQFMPATARAYHLRVIENTVDERRSPPKSTEAAIRYLRDMHQKLGSWDLTFAGYNMGPFGLASRIERAGGGDIGFWDLVDAEMLPDDTADYAPAIQAIALILNNLQRLKFSGIQMRAPQLTSDLEVRPGTRLGLIARAAATSVTQLRALNLDISGDTTPNVPNFAIQVPKDVVWQARDALKDLLIRRDDMDLCVPPTFDWGRSRFTDEMANACRRRLPSLTQATRAP